MGKGPRRKGHWTGQVARASPACQKQKTKMLYSLVAIFRARARARARTATLWREENKILLLPTIIAPFFVVSRSCYRAQRINVGLLARYPSAGSLLSSVRLDNRAVGAEGQGGAGSCGRSPASITIPRVLSPAWLVEADKIFPSMQPSGQAEPAKAD